MDKSIVHFSVHLIENQHNLLPLIYKHPENIYLLSINQIKGFFMDIKIMIVSKLKNFKKIINILLLK